MELEKIGTKTPDGTYILEGNVAYIEQEEKGKVIVRALGGIDEIVHIDKLDDFVKSINDGEVKEELEILISKILNNR